MQAKTSNSNAGPGATRNLVGKRARSIAAVSAIFAILAAGIAIQGVSSIVKKEANGRDEPGGMAFARDDGNLAKSRAGFAEAVVLMAHNRHSEALEKLKDVIRLNPKMPEAHVNAGFALLEMKRPKEARFFFQSAIDMRPSMENPYYGLGEALIELGETNEAIGAMKTFVHLSEMSKDRQFSRFEAKAKAAIVEMQASIDDSSKATDKGASKEKRTSTAKKPEQAPGESK